MNQGKYVFAQIVEFLPQRLFDTCVEKYNGNKWTKHFSCWNQLLCMMFGQLSGRDSLRDLLVSIGAHKQKYYHLGFGKNVSRSNLANANEQRDYRIYEDFAYILISQARKLCISDIDLKDIDGPVYAFDSTLVDLCLNVFWWAEFRKHKAAVKIHTLFDIRTSIPAFIYVTEGSYHDVNALDLLQFEPQGFYIMDRGYMDFERLYHIHRSLAFFVTRAKENLKFKRISAHIPDKTKGVMCDQIIRLKGYYSNKKYPEPLRRIKYYDKDAGRRFVFLTNNIDLKATDIALLYKYRWLIELFFKWIKQHLKIKSFWGTSPNAVKTQIFIAIITYSLVSIIKQKMKTEYSIYETLQILGVSLLDKTPIQELLLSQIYQNVKEQNYIQLKMNLI
ncbi:MAG: IS4 family transposase [Bacteroidia bacterium]|nr:IS4 family transposase [Bacteroidia bacterium]